MTGCLVGQLVSPLQPAKPKESASKQTQQKADQSIRTSERIRPVWGGGEKGDRRRVGRIECTGIHSCLAAQSRHRQWRPLCLRVALTQELTH